MNKIEIVSNAVWFSMPKLSNRKIENGFRALWEDTLKYLDIYPRSGALNFNPWIKIGDCFYLIHTASHSSPGDICGFLKGNEYSDPRYLDREDEVIAVRIDQDWHIPHQGLCDKDAQSKFANWKDQAKQYYFVRRSRDSS